MIATVTGEAADLVAEGREALRVGDAAAARRAFDAAAARDAGPEIAEGLGRVAYLELDFRGAIPHWEEAYAGFRDAQDALGAVRVARMLSCLYMMVVGDYAVANGWLARAQTLLDATGDSPERGWVALDFGMFETDRTRKEEHFREALAVARATGDRELEFVGLAYLGASLVHADQTEAGMVLLDEALAAVAGGEVDDFFLFEDIFCQLFSACEHAHDVARADQWIRVGDAIARRRNLPTVAAFCHTHYGAVLTAAGRWPEADAALTDAVRLWDLGQRSRLRTGALARLADLRVRQGRIEEAEQLLDGLDSDTDVEVARARAAVHLARGSTSLARHEAERALAQLDTLSTTAAPLLGMLVDVHLAAGALDQADRTAQQLVACAAAHPAHQYLAASAALARGRVCLASGTGDPLACLHEALAGFSKAQLPMERARARLHLANALADESPEAALAEARAALASFERLQAARDADAAAATLRMLGARPASPKASSGVLTKREAEVLDLLGHGLSNPEIADRLYISRKTAEHHVGNVLAKLGLRSRAEAAAYAARGKPEPK